MRPGKQEKTGAQDLFGHGWIRSSTLSTKLVRLAGPIDWDWVDAELAERFNAEARPDTPTRLMVGFLLLKAEQTDHGVGRGSPQAYRIRPQDQRRGGPISPFT